MRSKQADEFALIKEEYLQALARNKDAKAELREVLKHSTDQVTANASSRPASKRDCLTAHLGRLRLERQYDDLQTVAHYFGQAETIANHEKLYDPLAVKTSNTQISSNHDTRAGQNNKVEQAQQRVHTLLDNAKTLTTNLELALAKARQQLKHEKLLLERAKAQSEGMQDDRNLGVQLKALEVTRNELQAWIGDSLAACEREAFFPESELLTTSSDDDPAPTVEESDAAVLDGYDRYIEARKGLLAATRALRSPLPAQESDESPVEPKKPPIASQAPTTLRPPYARYKSNTSGSRLVEHSMTPSLAEIQNVCLPEYYHEKLLSTYTAHLEDQIIAQDARLLQVLNLLSHESHLLPTYPLPSTHQSQTGSANNLNQQQLEIEGLLQHWAYASGAASEALELSVQNNTQDARGALRKADTSVEEMYVMESMRTEVLGKP